MIQFCVACSNGPANNAGHGHHTPGRSRSRWFTQQGADNRSPQQHISRNVCVQVFACHPIGSFSQHQLMIGAFAGIDLWHPDSDASRKWRGPCFKRNRCKTDGLEGPPESDTPHGAVGRTGTTIQIGRRHASEKGVEGAVSDICALCPPFNMFRRTSTLYVSCAFPEVMRTAASGRATSRSQNATNGKPTTLRLGLSSTPSATLGVVVPPK